jgi:hypothetical protein
MDSDVLAINDVQTCRSALSLDREDRRRFSALAETEQTRMLA